MRVQGTARAVSVSIFALAALLALAGGVGEVGEGAPPTWGAASVVGLLIFGGANLVAAGLAALRGRNLWMRAVGVALLLLAVVLIANYKGDLGRHFAAAALVIVGGFVAGGEKSTRGGGKRKKT